MTENSADNNDGFLSERVREMYQEMDNAYEAAVDKTMEETGLDRDAAELALIRTQKQENKKKLQKAISTDDLAEKFQSGVVDYEGSVTSDGCVTNMSYVHLKRRIVDGVQVDIWAEEDEWESYFCTAPENVMGYRITIADYDYDNKGITFLISLGDVWTKEKIMQEFEDIVQQVKERVGLGVFEVMYGELSNVTWGSHAAEEPEE